MKHQTQLRSKQISFEELRLDLLRVAIESRWDRALLLIGWLHLCFFGIDQILFLQSYQSLIVWLWLVELIVQLGLLWQLLGPWWKSTPLASVLTRLWATFLIISFSAAVSNKMTGIDPRWYPAAWGMLSTFGLAATAWLCSDRFLKAAIPMGAVGFLMARWDTWSFALHGIAWWAVLQVTAYGIRKRRRLFQHFTNEQAAESIVKSQTSAA